VHEYVIPYPDAEAEREGVKEERLKPLLKPEGIWNA
jgi:hypothetical protein